MPRDISYQLGVDTHFRKRLEVALHYSERPFRRRHVWNRDAEQRIAKLNLQAITHRGSTEDDGNLTTDFDEEPQARRIAPRYEPGHQTRHTYRIAAAVELGLSDFCFARPAIAPAFGCPIRCSKA